MNSDGGGSAVSRFHFRVAFDRHTVVHLTTARALTADVDGSVLRSDRCAVASQVDTSVKVVTCAAGTVDGDGR